MAEPLRVATAAEGRQVASCWRFGPVGLSPAPAAGALCAPTQHGQEFAAQGATWQHAQGP